MCAAQARNERGSAMIIAIMLVLMVSLVGGVAVEESINSAYSAAVTAKGAQLVAAARAGVDAVVGSIEQAAQSDNTYMQSGSGSPLPLTCQSITSSSAYNLAIASITGAANPASAASYTTWYATGASSASAVGNLGQSISSGWTAGQCGSGGTTVMSEATFASETAAWYLAVRSTGAVSSTAYGAGKPVTAVVEFTPIGALENEFAYDLEGFTGINNGGDLSVTGGAFSPQLQCTNGTYNGNVFIADGTSPNFTSGGCDIVGNIFVVGDITVNQLKPTGSIFATGNVTITDAGAQIGGDVVAGGNVTIDGGTVAGSVFAGGTVTTSNSGEVVNGSVYASGTGSSTIGGGSFALNSGAGIYLNGSVTLSSYPTIGVRHGSGGNVVVNGNITVSGAKMYGPAWVSSGHTITVHGTGCANGGSVSGGPTTCYTSFTGSTPAPGYLSGPSETSPFFGTSECPGSQASQYVADAPQAPIPFVACDSTTSPYGIQVPQQVLASLTAFPSMTLYPAAWENSTFEPNGGGSSGINWVNDNSCTYSGVYADLRAMATATKPTVISTTCAIDWGDTTLSGGGPLSLNQNLAVFSGNQAGSGTSGGFTFENDGSPGSVNGNGHLLYLMVPWAGGVTPPNGQTTCPGSLTGTPNNGDMYVVNQLTNVEALLYTPDYVCTAASPTLEDGKVYAGGIVSPAGSSAFDPVIAPSTPLFPYGVTNGGAGTVWSPSVVGLG